MGGGEAQGASGFGAVGAPPEDGAAAPGGTGRWRYTGLVAEISVEVLDATRRLEPGALAWLIGRIEAAVLHLGAAGEVRVRIVGD